MKLATTTALLLAALAAPSGAAAQDSRPDGPYEVYPAEPVGPEEGFAGDSLATDSLATDSLADEESTEISFSAFERPLAAYGDWVTVGGHGTVWRPRVPAGWRPYYYGRWEWTNEGWLWVSEEPFGWATYHYGRWSWDRGYGWLWLPGYQWAPAWVTWRYSGDAVGWAPLSPGLSLYVTDFAFVDFWWTFVPTVRFTGLPIHRWAYAPGHTRRWYDTTRPAPPRPSHRGGVRPGADRPYPPAWGGPSPRLVEERIGRPLRPARIVPTTSGGIGRGRPGEIGVFRPEARQLTSTRFRDDRRSPGLRTPAGRDWERGQRPDGPPGRMERGDERHGARGAPGVAPGPGRGQDRSTHRAPVQVAPGGRAPAVEPPARPSRELLPRGTGRDRGEGRERRDGGARGDRHR